MKQVTNVDFPVLETQRRSGDPACVVACSEQIRSTLGWTPQYQDLETIVRTAIAWEIKKLQGRCLDQTTPLQKTKAIAESISADLWQAVG